MVKAFPLRDIYLYYHARFPGTCARCSIFAYSLAYITPQIAAGRASHESSTDDVPGPFLSKANIL